MVILRLRPVSNIHSSREYPTTMEDAAAAAAGITPRQIWAKPTTTKSQPYSSDCTPFVLPSAGMVYLVGALA